MLKEDFNIKKVSKRIISVILAAALSLVFIPVVVPVAAAQTGELPEAVYTGSGNVSVMLGNMDLNDVKQADAWVKDAVYEAIALNLMKSYGTKTFGLQRVLTKEQAIAAVYKASGREADAQKAGEAINAARQPSARKKDFMSILYDGYLQLAAGDGLLTKQELADALSPNQSALNTAAFHRNAVAQRQEMAYWLAKVLKIPPEYDQQSIFNNFKDWKNVQPAKVPYIEAMLKNGIMSGDGTGSFGPAMSVNMEQAARIVKNAGSFILPLFRYEKKAGTVESVYESADMSRSEGISTRTYNIRNSEGRLHQISVQYASNTTAISGRNEKNGKPLSGQYTDLLVYKNGQLGKSDLLEAGDRIEYITGPDKTVKYVGVLSSVRNTAYFAARINSIDTAKLTMNVTLLYRLDYPDMNARTVKTAFDSGNGQYDVTYRYSNAIFVSVDNNKSDIAKLGMNTDVILSIRDNMVVEARTRTVKLENGAEGGIVKGIVEDSNPNLGYITLYNEDGTGTDPKMLKQLIALRTYNYTDPNRMEVLKNGKKADVKDIEAGDSVFLKTDMKSNIVSISAVDNYTARYGKVIYKRPSGIDVMFDDGSVLPSIELDPGAIVIAGGIVTEYDRLVNGDRVRLLLNITPESVRIKEITIEDDGHLISGIYKGKVLDINTVSNNIMVQDLEVLYRGNWSKTEQKGITAIRFADQYEIYAGGKKTDTEDAGKLYRDGEAYIAVVKDYGGDERAAVVSFRDGEDTEFLYDDKISVSAPGSGMFGLDRKHLTIRYGTGSIIIKDGRMVTGRSISVNDEAYVVANRKNQGSAGYVAGIVQLGEKADNSFVDIYRGRIKQINRDDSFTIESFSRLKGNAWEYVNTPKTFSITCDTRILTDTGVIGQRDFVDYGDNSFVNRVVCILADGVNAIMVNTVAYGGFCIKGEIYEITGGSVGEEGDIIQEPSGIKLKNTGIYDQNAHIWIDGKNMSLNLLKNSIILKDNEIARPSDLMKGDSVKVFRKDGSETGDAYIVIVE